MQPDFIKLKPVTSQPNFATLKPISEPVKEKATGFQSFVQAVSQPILKIASRAAQLGNINNVDRYNKVENEGIDYGYFGNAKPIGAGFDVTKGLSENKEELKDIIGTSVEVGATFAGGGGSVGAVKTGLKGLIKQGAKEGLKVGASTGSAMGFGQALQDAESKPMDVAYNTIFGAALGGVAGSVLGAATPAVVKGVQKAKSYTKIPELEAKLSEGYRKIFNPTAKQIKADTRFGGDSFKFISQEMPDLPVKVDSAGRVDAGDAIEMAKMKYSAEAAAYKPIIRNSGKYVDIDDTISQMKRAARKEFDGSDLTKAEQQIENEVEAYLRNNPQDINVTESGKRFVTLSRADDIKSYSWSRGKGWGTPEAEVWNDTNNIIGHALKDAIERELPTAPIKAMNKRLGQWKNAIDMLEKRNGTVNGNGGKAAKYLARTAGSLIGGAAGGNDGGIGGTVTGAGTGFLTATALASMMANPNVRLYVVRQLLNKLNKAGRKDMIQEAETILQEQASRYLLPAAGKSSYVEKPIILPKSVSDYNLGLNEVRGMNQSQPKNLSTTEPIAAPTTQATKNSIIDETVPQKPNNASGLKEVSGGVAGIEVKKDENGKTIVSFNPEKAAIGIIGMTSYNKLSPAIKKEIKIKLNDKIGAAVNDAFKTLDSAPVKTNQGFAYGNTDTSFRILQLQEKANTKGLSRAETIEAIPLLKGEGIDIMKDLVKKEVTKPKFKQNPVTGKLEGSTASSPLIQEAKKYKSAEEFVAAQPKLYHSGTADIKEVNTNKSNFSKTFYMSDKADYAKSFGGAKGSLNEIVLDKSANLADMRKPSSNLVSQIESKLKRENAVFSDKAIIDGIKAGKAHFAELPEVKKALREIGYDGQITSEVPYAKNIGVWNKDVVKTKSQLTDIWNKANKK